ncbi:MAG TPA: ribonuclease P protein subunit [Nitrososphaerales archaeon]|nr:ribonuclease P protein subunit [Nitrososphaerales archaeon]
MSVVGEEISIVGSRDPSMIGRAGEVVLETSNTLRLDEGGRTIVVPKAGAVFQVQGSKRVINGSEIVGRLEDRLRLKKK